MSDYSKTHPVIIRSLPIDNWQETGNGRGNEHWTEIPDGFALAGCTVVRTDDDGNCRAAVLVFEQVPPGPNVERMMHEVMERAFPLPPVAEPGLVRRAVNFVLQQAGYLYVRRG